MRRAAPRCSEGFRSPPDARRRGRGGVRWRLPSWGRGQRDCRAGVAGGSVKGRRMSAAARGRLIASMSGAPDENRLRALLDAGVALTSELSLDSLLQKLVETAASLTGARYAALGVIDENRTELERFVTAGVDDATHASIGELPRGRGILGVLIR